MLLPVSVAINELLSTFGVVVEAGVGAATVVAVLEAVRTFDCKVVSIELAVVVLPAVLIIVMLLPGVVADVDVVEVVVVVVLVVLVVLVVVVVSIVVVAAAVVAVVDLTAVRSHTQWRSLLQFSLFQLPCPLTPVVSAQSSPPASGCHVSQLQ